MVVCVVDIIHRLIVHAIPTIPVSLIILRFWWELLLSELWFFLFCVNICFHYWCFRIKIIAFNAYYYWKVITCLQLIDSKHLHGNIISLRLEVWTHKEAYPHHFYCTKPGKWAIVLLYVRGTCIDFVSVSMIFLLDYRIATTAWYFLFFILFIHNGKKVLILFQISLFLTLIGMINFVVFVVCLIRIHLVQS